MVFNNNLYNIAKNVRLMIEKKSDLAVFGLVPRAWHAGLAQWAGWVRKIIPSRAVGAANIRGGEVCVPQVLSILTLGTW